MVRKYFGIFLVKKYLWEIIIKRYIWNIAISLDQLCNSILAGSPDETMSSRMGKHLAKHDKCPVCNFVCKLLNLIQKDHCIKSIEKDEGMPM